MPCRLQTRARRQLKWCRSLGRSEIDRCDDRAEEAPVHDQDGDEPHGQRDVMRGNYHEGVSDAGVWGGGPPAFRSSHHFLPAAVKAASRGLNQASNCMPSTSPLAFRSRYSMSSPIM